MMISYQELVRTFLRCASLNISEQGRQRRPRTRYTPLRNAAKTERCYLTGRVKPPGFFINNQSRYFELFPSIGSCFQSCYLLDRTFLGCQYIASLYYHTFFSHHYSYIIEMTGLKEIHLLTFLSHLRKVYQHMKQWLKMKLMIRK